MLSGEDARLAGRLVAIDRLVDPLSTAEMLASNVGCLAQPLTWLPAATSRLAESSSPDAGSKSSRNMNAGCMVRKTCWFRGAPTVPL